MLAMKVRTHVRRTLPVVLLLVSIAAPALAEKSNRFGVRAGVNLSAFTGEFGDLVKPDNRVAPNIALVYEHAFAPEIAFHTELGYAGKGGALKNESTDPFGNPTLSKIDWRFEYLEVPLLFRGRWPGKATPFFELGPSIGIALAGKIVAPDLGGELDVKHDMKPLDLGWAAGAGVEFAAGSGRIGLEARYTRGFSDLYDINDNFPSINQAWTFALSYMR